MSGVKPDVILTNQCLSIEKGIEKILSPHTIHRFCSWHILHKLSAKWGNVDDKSEKTDLRKDVLYGSYTQLQFQTRWDNLISELGYQDNVWFKSIFYLRDKWVPTHMNDRFWAGMTSTQRVESMNNFLNKYLKYKATLGEFVVPFEEGLKRIWEREH
jgi:hypothetical protein